MKAKKFNRNKDKDREGVVMCNDKNDYTGIGAKTLDIIPQDMDKAWEASYEILPEIVPNIAVVFEYRDALTLCFVRIKQAVRVGTAVCSESDVLSRQTGEKLSLKRALIQCKLCHIVRRALWEQYLYTVGIKKQPDPIIDFFKNKCTFRM